MKILATDLDRTLLPNGRWPADARSIPLFNELTNRHDVLVVYVTGRNLSLTEQAIEQYGVRHPHVLIGDVGTTIRRYDGGQWRDDEGWAKLIHERSPRWDRLALREALSTLDGLTEQAAEHLNAFKQSYDIDHRDREAILAEIGERVEGRFDEVFIYSYDSQADKGLLDFLPNSATKLTALAYAAEKAGAKNDDVVFCGDSGNDIFPLTAGFNGVLVRNADEQLVENVLRAQRENPSVKLYFAKGEFQDLNGYYTSGVIEGAYHYGLFATT